MEVPTNILKEVKGGFGKPTAYEKEGVDAYIGELTLQLQDAQSAAEFRQKELNEAQLKIKKLEESRLLDGDHNDAINNLNEKLKKATNELDATRKSYAVADSRCQQLEKEIQKASQKIAELTEECNKYDAALAQMKANSSHSGGVNASSQELFTLKQSMAEMESENERLRIEVKNAKTNLVNENQSVQQLEQLKAAIAARDEVIADKDRILEDKTTQLAVKENELLKAQTDIEKLNESLSAYEETAEKLKASQDNANALNEANSLLTQKNNEQEQKITELEKRIKELETSGNSGSINLDVSDVFAEAQKSANQFLNAAKEKASALTEETERKAAETEAAATEKAAQIVNDATNEAEQIKENAKQDAEELLSHAKQHMGSLDDLMALMRADIIKKLDEASAIAAEHADKFENASAIFFGEENSSATDTEDTEAAISEEDDDSSETEEPEAGNENQIDTCEDNSEDDDESDDE